MACVPSGFLGVVALCVLLGCAAASPVNEGSVAETQLHAPCPPQGGCVEPLSCIGGAEEGEPSSCELACSGVCPGPLSCMPRPDGQRGGVCREPPEGPRGWGR
jgi:hypothetical protein